jgi:beta-1,2-mannosidase
VIPLTTTGLARSYEHAAALRRIHLSQDQFSRRYEEESGWALGPFTQDRSLTFSPTVAWPDPTNVGWTASAIFNPSLILHDGHLVVFYRASPSMESTASRIGMAMHDPETGWVDSADNPVIYPTQENELLGCEDPKIYRSGGRYFLFYHGIFPIDPRDAVAYPSPDFQLGHQGCDINLAVSDDLQHWTKVGPVVPHDVSRLWCKGAVIPRDPDGNAVRIGGEFLMYVSEGCNGRLQVGRSHDLVHWTFEERAYLDISPLKGALHEVACATTAFAEEGHLVLDLFYRDEKGTPRAAQALYRRDEPFTQLALGTGGTLSWGGLLHHRGTWLFAQGWDAPEGIRELYFYRSDRVSAPMRGQPARSHGA